MNTFLVIAAVMAAIAAGAVALPLLRDRQSRLLGALVAVTVIGASAGLYPLWSNWNWHAPAPSQAAAGPDVAAMIAKLERRLQDQPNDPKGWSMLGRSYLALNRLDEAIVAYGHAHQLDSKDPEAAMGLGEAMSLRAGGEITPQAGQMLDARIAELGPPSGSSATRTADTSPPGTGASPAGSNASTGASSGAEVTVNISIAPALKSRLVSEASLFVFAREPGSRGPPLAAKRLTSTAIGTQVHLSQADSMLPGRVLAKGQQVSITARVSFSGQPVPSAGDLYGVLSYDVGRDGVRNLVIDRVAE